MQHLLRNSILVVLVLAFFSWGLWPPKEKIRLGKDLRGGVTLVYQLQVDPGQDADEIRKRTIEVLKERIDPSGLLEISIIAQGRDRIEITMPLPSDEIKALRKAVDDEIEALRGMALTETQLNRILSLPPAERDQEIQRVSRDNSDRKTMLQEAAAAFDLARQTRAEYDTAAAAAKAGDPDADPETVQSLLEAAADAQLALDGVIKRVVSSTPQADEIRAALEKSNQGREIYNSKTGELIKEESPRAQAIASLNERYPDATPIIDRIVAAHDKYLAKRTTLDDPADLIRLIKNAGVLSFRISCDAQGDKAHPRTAELRAKLQKDGPRRAGASDARWFKINKIKSWYDKFEQYEAIRDNPVGFFASIGENGYVVEFYEGDYWMLCWDRPGWRLTQTDDNLGEWGVASAGPGQDRVGRPAINFVMDARGAVVLGELTGAHIGDNMAVLLDDEVYTAPVLNGRISRQGQIAGNFSQEELDYIIRVLSAGSLQAKLSPEPISQSTIGPSLGADNLHAGMIAGVAGLLAVSAFMILYYFRCGMIAVVALACNALLILGALALNKAALTLPGIAGIVLTFGMAVDANVLIYERIREELRDGADIRTAIRLGYQKALSSIVDGNITNLIICIVLVLPGVSTQEVKGFAITLGVGVLATLFSALIITRILFTVMVDYGGWKNIKMLPMVIKPLERLLQPKVNWLKLRWAFIIISTIYVSIGLTMVFGRGSKMLDTEFLGGTKIILKFKIKDPAEMLTREQVAQRVVAIGERALEDDDSNNDALGGLRGASVLPQNPQPDGVSSDTFQITTTVLEDQLISEALQREFAKELDSTPPITFAGQDDFRGSVFPIISPDLRTNLGDRSTVGLATADVTDYLGGVVVLLDKLDPPIPLADLRSKIERVRETDMPESLARQRTLIVLSGDEEHVLAAAMVVRDDDYDYITNPDSWEQNLARSEWQLAHDSLGRVTTLAEIQKFSPSIASSFKGRAVAAILLSFLFITIYIWVRFGTVRYSIAAIVCLMHDVLTCVGLIALAEIVYDMPSVQDFVRSIGIQPFKIDLTMIAAILTIIGYSLNDTIIIMDRIRENKGRLSYASTRVINDSVNQTISRTIITSGTTLIAVLILYIFGGDGVRAFSFALLVGVVVGTYSSIAVAAPLVWSRKRTIAARIAAGAEPSTDITQTE